MAYLMAICCAASCGLSCSPTSAADPTVEQFMPLYDVSALQGSLLVQDVIIGHLEIVHAAAAVAAEVGVGCCICIIALDREGHTHNRPLIHQQV